MLIQIGEGRRFLNKVRKSKAGIWVMDVLLPRDNNVLAVLRTPRGKTLIPAHNLVTDAGDLYYAQLGASEATTNAFGIMELATITPTQAKGDNRSNYTVAVAGTQKAFDGTYPKTNDGDGDNTGAGTDVVTYLVSYTTGDFNDTGLVGGIITNVTPGASEPIMTGWDFAASFDKTATDTLKVFVNHTMNGV